MQRSVHGCKLLKQYPDRFLFGSDAVAPKTQADYLKAYDAYQKLWDRLDADTASQSEVAQLRAHLRCGSAESEGVGGEAGPKVRVRWGARNAALNGPSADVACAFPLSDTWRLSTYSVEELDYGLGKWW